MIALKRENFDIKMMRYLLKSSRSCAKDLTVTKSNSWEALMYHVETASIDRQLI
ncbi:hypothetical protein KFK09_020579 [Dendrobium nobile]|uniref:Uncharacterized protein n=1 Tax=Dendrobium nobile TaxID=94219 RepID=A0A8T3ALC4_DENNO|nr:hypothetical protein KFK09_020579 [Dendrobium nobile]